MNNILSVANILQCKKVKDFYIFLKSLLIDIRKEEKKYSIDIFRFLYLQKNVNLSVFIIYCRKIRQALDEILERTQKMRSEQLNIKKELHDKLNFTEQQLMLLTQEMKDKIHHMVEDVEQKVSKALNEEIRRLAVLIDEFSVPFHPEPLVLNVYKRELHTHVENGLGDFELYI